MDKNTVNVLKCLPQPRSGDSVCAHRRGMRERPGERSIEYKVEPKMMNKSFIC